MIPLSRSSSRTRAVTGGLAIAVGVFALGAAIAWDRSSPPAGSRPALSASGTPATSTVPGTAPAAVVASAADTTSPSTAPAQTTVPPTTAAPTTTAAPATRVAWTVEPYTGLGAWVDVYDWSHYKQSTPVVGPDQVDQMAAEGVQTLFIQTAKHDTPDVISEPELLMPILERARQRGLRIVAWYLPTLEDPANDMQRLLASARLPVDGLAVDIEARNVGDVGERNRRLVQLSADLRAALPGKAIGAITLPPVVTEVINPNYWPSFPWREIAPFYDVWQIMGYWTNRTHGSGYRDAYRYTDENVRRLRANVGRPDAPIHPIGGIGDRTTDVDLDGFVRAAAAHGAIGGSIYDFRTTSPAAWDRLRTFRKG